MSEEWVQIGMGGVLALLVIREFSSLLKYFLDKKSISGGNGRSADGGDNTYRNPLCAECRRKIEETHNMVSEIHQRKQRIEEIHTQVRELHEMHNHKDSDGVYVWYVKRSLEDAMDKLAEAVNKQTLLLERLFDQWSREAEERRRTGKP